MISVQSVDKDDTIQKIMEETGMEREAIDTRINEIIQKYSGMLTEQGALILLSKELHVRNALPAEKGQSLTLGEIKDGMNNIDVKATVKIADRVKTFSKNGKEGKYLSIRLADETGEALFTFWNEQAEEAIQKGLQTGSAVSFTNLRAGTFNGMIQLSLGYNSMYEVNNENVTTPPAGITAGGNKSVSPANPAVPIEKKETPFVELKENENVWRKAHIIDVLPNRGFYGKCLKCQGKVQEIVEDCPTCGEKGKVEIRLLLPLLLDDGTKPLRAVGFEEQVLQIMGKTKEDVLNNLKNSVEKEKMEHELLGKIIEMEGRTKIGMDNTSVEIMIRNANVLPFSAPDEKN